MYQQSIPYFCSIRLDERGLTAIFPKDEDQMTTDGKRKFLEASGASLFNQENQKILTHLQRQLYQATVEYLSKTQDPFS